MSIFCASVLLTAFGFTFFAGCASQESKDKAFENDLVQIVEEANKELPIMADPQTRVDKIESLGGKKLRYTYTFVNISIDDINVEEFKEFQNRTLKALMKQESSLSSFKKRQVTFVYAYFDNSGKPIAEFEYAPSDYNINNN